MAVCLTITASYAGVVSPARAAVGDITEFAVPTAASNPLGITAGPDGNLWFTEALGRKIGRITLSGSIEEFALPAGGGFPQGIAPGPDGNLWFTDGNKVGRITTSGAITEFDVQTTTELGHIVAGPDGNLWFTEFSGGIGRITPGGTVSEFATPTPNPGAFDIAVGADGNLWFTEVMGNKVATITPTGTVTEFALPTAGSFPSGIAAGSDGNVWFAENGTSTIGRITPAGVISEFALPARSNPVFVGSGPDGNVWFTGDDNLIGRITPAGTITLFRTPESLSIPLGIAAGPDGNVWFTEAAVNRIARLTLDTTAPTLILPDGVTVDATSSAGAAVAYTVNATDPDDAVVELTCLPSSGSTFPIGDTGVVCTARDSNGNVATGGFVVHVRGANEQLSALRLQVASLKLLPFITRSLDLELQLAQTALSHGQNSLANTALLLFTAEVRALPEQMMNPTVAADLVAAATRIRNVIGR